MKTFEKCARVARDLSLGSALRGRETAEDAEDAAFVLCVYFPFARARTHTHTRPRARAHTHTRIPRCTYDTPLTYTQIMRTVLLYVALLYVAMFVIGPWLSPQLTYLRPSASPINTGQGPVFLQLSDVTLLTYLPMLRCPGSPGFP
jgi:hypothetical protein